MAVRSVRLARGCASFGGAQPRRPLSRAPRAVAPPHATLAPRSAGAGALARRLVPLLPAAAALPGAPPPLRLLQWNCLADGLAQHGDFVKCPPGALDWAHRAPLLLAEIEAAGLPDLVCLQEVNHFDELAAALRALGYDGVFAEKRHSPCVGLGFPADGLALFWRSARLRPVCPPAHAFFVSPDSGEEYSQCYLWAPLADVAAGGRELLLATTHLKAKGGAACDAVRRAEAEQLAKHLTRHLAAAQPGAAALLAGDFNTELDSDAMAGFRQAAGMQPVPLPPAPDGTAFTTWKFRTARPTGNGNGNGNDHGHGVPLAGAGFGLEGGEKMAAIDHVFHSPALRPSAAWAAPGRAACGPAGLPTDAYPSDHVAQLVELTWL